MSDTQTVDGDNYRDVVMRNWTFTKKY